MKPNQPMPPKPQGPGVAQPVPAGGKTHADSAAGEEDPGSALDEMVKPTAPSAEPPKPAARKPG